MGAKNYTVLGVYPDDHGRYADSVEAETPAEAERLIREKVQHDSGWDIIVAGVIEGEAKIVA